jgi:hypothetical protein
LRALRSAEGREGRKHEDEESLGDHLMTPVEDSG